MSTFLVCQSENVLRYCVRETFTEERLWFARVAVQQDASRQEEVDGSFQGERKGYAEAFHVV